MKTYSFNAIIQVEGKNVKTESDAIGEIQCMLNDYEDNNKSSGAADIYIQLS